MLCNAEDIVLIEISQRENKDKMLSLTCETEND